MQPEHKGKPLVTFLLGLFIGRYGIPIIMHLIYLGIIGILLIKHFPALTIPISVLCGLPTIIMIMLGIVIVIIVLSDW